MLKATAAHCFFSPVFDTKAAQEFPSFTVHRMQQIEVSICYSQTIKLLIQQAVEILRSLNKPDWHLCGDFYFFAVPVLESQADYHLACSHVICICCVNVIDP